MALLSRRRLCRLASCGRFGCADPEPPVRHGEGRPEGHDHAADPDKRDQGFVIDAHVDSTVALGGALTAPMISVSPGSGVNVIIIAFAVVIIGGLGSIEGAAIGALFVGIARAASVHLLPEAELFIIYLVMAAVLVFRPEGLFQKTEARKI